VPIVDLIEASFAHGNGRQAFVLNSDILLTGNLMQFTSEPFSGVLLLPRWGIDRFPEPSKRELNPWGWDGIILGSDLRKKYNNPRFAMGLPWWDYWIPFRAIHLGAEVKILEGKLALHVDHPEKWDEEDRAALAGEMWREVGIGPLRRLWLRHLGPKRERKIYGYHNHLAGHVREMIKKPI